jgi:hypothetical protein
MQIYFYFLQPLNYFILTWILDISGWRECLQDEECYLAFNTRLQNY